MLAGLLSILIISAGLASAELARVSLSAKAAGYATGTPASGIVNVNAKLGMIPPDAFGLNTPVFDGRINDAVVPAKIRATAIKVFRYPGGGTAEAYSWETNKVNPAISPTGNNPGPIPATAANFDAFMQIAQKSGASAMITVNYGSGTAQEAANWVQYANKGGRHYQAKGGFVPSYTMPSPNPNGHDFDIKNWEIGNEAYGDGTYNAVFAYNLHATGPAAYASAVVQYSKAMKAIDDTIHIGAVLTMPGNFPDGVTNAKSPQSWNTTVLSQACPALDFVDVHWYPQNPAKSGFAAPESDAQLLQAPENGTPASTSGGIAAMVSRLRSDITANCGSHANAVTIRVTETNSVSFDAGKQTVSLVNALYQNDNYMSWLENGVENVSWWDLHNSNTARTVGVTKINNDPNLFPQGNNIMYGDYGILSDGTCDPTNLICEPPLDSPFPTYAALQLLTHLGAAGDTMVNSISGNPTDITLHAVKQRNGHLAVMVINKNPTITFNVMLTLSGFKISTERAKVFTIGQESQTSVATSFIRVSGSKASLSVAPYSSNVIVL